MFKRKNYSLKDEAFLSQMESFISAATNNHRNRLSPVELYALRYEFLADTIVSSQTPVTQISTKDLISLFNGNRAYTLLMHEEKGLLYPDEEYVVFTKNNNVTFNSTDLLASLNKRMTFFVGAFYDKSDSKSDYDRQFVVHEVLIYVPSKKDTTMYLERFDLDDELFKSMFESDAKVIENVIQDGVMMSKVPSLVAPDFEKEFFAFTKMKVDGATFVFHYVP